MRHLKSLREYIACLERLGEIQPIDVAVDWNLEAGAVTRRSYDLRAPAPLFNNITGIERGFRLLGAPAGLSRQPGLELCRVAVSLGLSPTASAREIVDAIARGYTRAPVPPVVSSTGPCKENVLRGDAVDLHRLPVPFIHDGDGGRYLNTWGAVIARAPDGRWTNWCITRVMLNGPRSLVGLVAPRQHLGILHAKWRELRKPMPFALAIGCEPAIPFVAAMPLPEEVSEVDFLGGYFGTPIELVRAETVDLLVPATAEIVIEGTISHDERATEGPMGEYAGYIEVGKSLLQPVFHVSAVTHRSDPILPLVAAGVPVEEDHTCWGTVVAGSILAALRRADFPVGTVFSPFESALHWLVVTVRAEARGAWTQARLIERLREITFPTKPGRVVPKILLVDDDIDPSNLAEVVWAFATRAHPERGTHLFREVPVTPLQPYLSREERKSGTSSKVVYDCLWPDDMPRESRPRRASFKEAWPDEIQRRVLDSWAGYGYR